MEEAPKKSFINGNKGVIVAVVIGVVVAIIGLKALLGLGSADQYKGMLERLDKHSQQLKIDN